MQGQPAHGPQWGVLPRSAIDIEPHFPWVGGGPVSGLNYSILE